MNPTVRIRQETFGGAGAAPKAPLSTSASAGSSLEFAPSGKTITAFGGRRPSGSGRSSGSRYISACRQGQCGTCKTRLLDGRVEMSCENGFDPEPKAKGYVLTLRWACGRQREAGRTKVFVLEINFDPIGFCAMNQMNRMPNGLSEPEHEWAVILAGGDGTRLRDLSFRVSGDQRPKQFCPFFGGKSLLQHTRERLEPVFPASNTLLVLNRAHEIYYQRQLSDASASRILAQPSNRGTAVAIALSVLDILKHDAEARIAFFPSDHHYFEPSIFRATVREGLRLARCHCDKILIIGAPSTYPEVDYGWIQPGPTVADSLQFVSGFWEKPSHEEATLLYRRGCLWNTFVMIGLAGSFLELLQATLPHFVATIGLDLSTASLDGRYAAIGAVDFSKDVLSRCSERLLVLRDGPSGWTDFGSPERAMSVLHALGSRVEFSKPENSLKAASRVQEPQIKEDRKG